MHRIPRVVALGGGHGLGRVLSSLSFLGNRLTGIVATTDNGGSSGRLRQDAGCIAWGDLRNCMTELVANPSVASLLFGYRFTDAGTLDGQSLGNLMILGADRLTARPLDAIDNLRELLGIVPKLLPMTEEACDLIAVTEEEQALHGEIAIARSASDLRRLALTPVPTATPEALQAIEEADIILLGPGSFYTSVMPPLLVPGLRAALRAARAHTIWLPNITPSTEGDCPDELVQWRWLQRTLGPSQVGAMLWPSHRELPQQFNSTVVRFDLASDLDAGKHDRSKFVAGLERLLCEVGRYTLREDAVQTARATLAQKYA